MLGQHARSLLLGTAVALVGFVVACDSTVIAHPETALDLADYAGRTKRHSPHVDWRV
jgi:hypothetical protein